ncbi:hypothetical protein D6C95_05502 [Aureobasidium pullulans]|nr:hypothetical protein D6C95_05502 [Aureobasidium pullulans]
MEPLAAMAKVLAAVLNQAAETFAFVTMELAETKATLTQTKKKALKDSIASREENIRQINEVISLTKDTYYEAAQRLIGHTITTDNTYGNAMYSARYHSTTELEKNTSRWTTENREAAIELSELLLQLDKINPITEAEPESA